MLNILNHISPKKIQFDYPGFNDTIQIPATLTRILPNTDFSLLFDVAYLEGAPGTIAGNYEIPEVPASWDIGIVGGYFNTNNEWHTWPGISTFPAGWNTKNITITLNLDIGANDPTTISFKNFRMLVDLPPKIQYLPILGVG